MEAFDINPPDWSKSAIHAMQFCCPRCGASSREAEGVWLNRRSPVYTESRRRKFQEFYYCQCGCAWWAWSDQRPPSDLIKSDLTEEVNPFDDF